VWTPEFAAAGWILDLDRFHASTADFFPAAVAANRWNGVLHALPWFIDVRMLYWRTDLISHPPENVDELERLALRAQEQGVPLGLVWQRCTTSAPSAVESLRRMAGSSSTLVRVTRCSRRSRARRDRRTAGGDDDPSRPH
jgi:hypothetical protein